MLSKIQREVLLVFGILCLTLLPVWLLVVLPIILRLPDDFKYQTDIISLDNLYDVENQEFIGAAQSDSTFSYQVVDAQPALLLVNNEFEVKSTTGEEIIHVVRRYGIDPITQQHVPGYGDRNRTGYLFGPRNVAIGESFNYWHVNYDQPIELRYLQTEQLQGLRVFHYRSSFTVDQTAELGYITEVGETLGMSTNVVLNVWIEPTTGWLVQYEDKGIVYQYDLASQQRLYPWNAYTNTMTESSVINQVQQAEQLRLLQVLVQWALPSLFMLLALFCLIPYAMGYFPRFDTLVQQLAPLVTGVVGLTITFGLVAFTHTVNQQKAQLLFRAHVNELVQVLDEHLHGYQKALDGGKGLFISSELVSTEEWGTYVRGINLESNYPGLQSMGFAAAERLANEQWSAPIIYLEPLDERLLLNVGLDLYQDAAWQAALDQARDTGTTTLTANKELRASSNNSVLNYMLIYLPYYRQGQTYTIEQRREQLAGYIYGVFNMDVLFQEMDPDLLDVPFAIYDVTTEQDNTRSAAIFQTDSYILSPDSKAESSTRHLRVFGRDWEIHFERSVEAQYLSSFENILPWLIGGIGILISILAAGVLLAAERGYLSINLRKRHK